ncbi:putative malate dehydrogenase (decarboxylating) [Helianthus annuus]|uniref:Malate dehydrogenase (Decarboxylating) n=2 Tax=Helianthus annuus TaxID=4232 RepID=A0A9K3IQE0_HELAN|nr:putative malate dehydrogenase (decarboxylating) [Helianthus annuus]KAJ0572344.1 putative malate dehydrogenase (decarboxylating) [Helianthus annuus]KAJ0910459.1 putative malate dehydrogenase (decarboxylating) [Helianthus annuus]
MTERDRLGLRGLLPPRVISFEQQYDRFMESFRSLEHNTEGHRLFMSWMLGNNSESAEVKKYDGIHH